MKAKLFSMLFLSLAMAATAQNFKLKAPAAAVIMDAEGKIAPRQIWILAGTAQAIGYLEAVEADQIQQVSMANVKSLYFFETEDFKKAVDLFESRKYDEAHEAFEQIRKLHEPVAALKNNPGVLAACYQVECLRKNFQLGEMAKEVSRIKPELITDEMWLKQIAIYPIWAAVGAGEWLKAEEMIKKLEKEKLPCAVRAQVSYCHGRVLEGLNKPIEALLPYQTAMVADFGGSEVVARESALRILEILHADPELKAAAKAYDESKGEKLIAGYGKLLEASGVASAYQLILGGAKPLPSKFSYLLKYKTDLDKKDGGDIDTGAEKKKEG